MEIIEPNKTHGRAERFCLFCRSSFQSDVALLRVDLGMWIKPLLSIGRKRKKPLWVCGNTEGAAEITTNDHGAQIMLRDDSSHCGGLCCRVLLENDHQLRFLLRFSFFRYHYGGLRYTRRVSRCAFNPWFKPSNVLKVSCRCSFETIGLLTHSANNADFLQNRYMVLIFVLLKKWFPM